MPASIADVPQLEKDVVLNSVCLQLLFHFSKKEPHDLRTHVQTEIRLLRKHGFKEVAVLPASLYKSAYDALTKA